MRKSGCFEGVFEEPLFVINNLLGSFGKNTFFGGLFPGEGFGGVVGIIAGFSGGAHL
jgi:hypothetical protein